MAVFLKGLNASLGRLIGVVTVIVALMAFADGFIIGSIIMAGAGVFLFLLESGRNSAPVGFAIQLTYFALIFLSLMFIVG